MKRVIVPDPSRRSLSTTHSPATTSSKSFSFVLSLLVLCSLGSVLLAQGANLPQQLGLHGGREIFEAACTACHGIDGGGTSETIAGFTRPDTFPHFNGCDETTPESTRDWKAVIRDGGAARGFSPIMPAFGDVLTDEQINQLLSYLRSFCREPDWPVGELNVPRALLTEKAFPESETVLTSAWQARGAPGIDNELTYERILGRHDQLEVAVPFSWIHKEDGGLLGGIGDIAVGVKHVLFSHLNQDETQPPYRRTGSILSVQGEVALATGDAARGLGTGETTVGLFAAYDVLFPARTFLQAQMGADLPLHTREVARSAFLRTAFGKSFSGNMELGRMWTPMVEVVADRDLIAGAPTYWDVIPEFQVTLNRRQHVRAAFGYRAPLNATAGRPRQIMVYFLWDWFDGGLFEGWK